MAEEYGYPLPRGQEVGAGGGVGIRQVSGLWWLGLVAAVALLFLCGACGPGLDAPPPPSEALLGFIDPTSVEVIPSGEGLAYYGLVNPEEPWAVHLLRVDLSRCELGLRVLEAPVSAGAEEGRSRVSELVTSQGEGLLAAVNGDFFTPEGLPVGTEVVEGETRRARPRPAFAWRPAGDPWMGIPALKGDSVLELGWPLSRREGDLETEAIGGFPLLLSNGTRVGDLEVSERPSFAAERHPRTAIGFDPEGDLLWVVVVDGRQADHSMGMTLPELTGLMEALSVDEAINLDGGGSSVMVLDGVPVSKPSDAAGERPVVNALGILRDPGLCRIGG